MDKIWEWICHLPSGLMHFLVFQSWSILALVFPDFGEGVVKAVEMGGEEMKVLSERRLAHAKEELAHIEKAKTLHEEADKAMGEALQALQEAKEYRALWERITQGGHSRGKRKKVRG